MLIKARKIFIMFNALLGIYAMIQVSGFSMDNIIAGVYGLGISYVEMIRSLAVRLYNFLFDFLDRRVVPDVPQKPSYPGWGGGPKERMWEARPMNPDGLGRVMEHARSHYPQTNIYLNTNNSGNGGWGSWLTSWVPSWVWYGLAGFVVLGVGYASYTYLYDTAMMDHILGRTRPRS